jgi:hypothetical protein
MIYNILDNGNVINTIVASEEFVQTYYPNSYVLVGPEPAPPAPPPIITKISMLTRLTDEEYVGILVAAKVDIEVEAWKNKFDTTGTVNLEDSRTISGMNLLVYKGLLTQERATEILTTPVQDSERP